MERNERIAVLDGLRAWAIILVVSYHLLDSIIPRENALTFFEVVPFRFATIPINGWMGVDLFFVLSGYLISTQLLGRYYDISSRRVLIAPFLKKRLLRIVPAYYFILTLFVSGNIQGYPFPGGMDHIYFRYFYHLIFMQDYLPSDISPVFWSLAVEVQFYLLAPFFVAALLALKTTKARVFVIGFLLMVLPAARFLFSINHPEINDLDSYFEQIRKPFHFQIDGLLSGMLCAILLRDDTIRRFIDTRLCASTLFSGGIAVILLFLFIDSCHYYDGVSIFEKTFISTILAIGFSLMLLGLIGGCFATSFFAWRGFFPIALVSYSAYLIHPIVLPHIANAMYKLIPVSGSLPLQYLISIPLAAFPIGILSYLCWKFIERPFIGIGNAHHQKDRRQTEEQHESDHVGDGR